MEKRQKAKKYYDRKAKSLPELVVGQPVRARISPKSTWKPAIVQQNIAPRSYIINANGRNYRRNRVDIRNTMEQQDISESTESTRQESIVQSNEPPSATASIPSDGHAITRSGRISKPPDRLNYN